jgi:Fur family ferric uptake transcriptional regulator
MYSVLEAQRRLGLHMQEHGLKRTRQRDQVLEVFYEFGGHASVDEVLAHVQLRLPGVGYATVYRTMKLFVEAGVAHERKFQDGQARYEPHLGDDHHDHLICLDCDRIFEFDDPVIEARQAEICSAHHLRPEHHRHEVYARCTLGSTCPHRTAATR